MTMNSDLYQQVILDHNRNPRNYRKLKTPTHRAEGFNPLCGDHLWVELEVDDTGKIKDIGFQGEGCAISKASASIMTEIIKNKNVADVERIFTLTINMLKNGDSEIIEKDLRKIKIFSTISKYPMRVKCASLAWYATKSAFENKKIISTESE
jgi:nitrogen fixation protein NifU and related proteins